MYLIIMLQMLPGMVFILKESKVCFGLILAIGRSRQECLVVLERKEYTGLLRMEAVREVIGLKLMGLVMRIGIILCLTKAADTPMVWESVV